MPRFLAQRRLAGEIVPAADLVTWCRLIGFRTHLSRSAEIANLRYRVLHAAARITRAATEHAYVSMPPGGGPPISTAWQSIRLPSGNHIPSDRPIT